MFETLSAFIASVTGKIVLGTAVAAAAAGGAQAFDVADLPNFIADQNAEQIVDVGAFGATNEEGDSEEGISEEGDSEQGISEEGDSGEGDVGGVDGEVEPRNHGEVVSEFARSTELEGCAKGQAIASLASGREEDGEHCEGDDGDVGDDGDDGDDGDVDSDGDEGDVGGVDGEVEPRNHGEVVSEFARSTELEGCAKGQAIASLASGKEKDAGHCERDGDDGDVDSDGDEGDVGGVDGEVEPRNHGEVVSEFARSTELEGCAKGQAIASLASGHEKDAGHCEGDSDDGDDGGGDGGDDGSDGDAGSFGVEAADETGPASSDAGDTALGGPAGEQPAVAWTPGGGAPPWAGNGGNDSGAGNGNGNGNDSSNGNGNGGGNRPGR